MLEGVHILSETVKDNYFFINFIGSSLVFLILFSIGILGLIYEIKGKSISGIIMSLLIILFVGFFIFVNFYGFLTRTQYKEYEVTIDDTVKINEFYLKYNIISQEGKVYTIIENNKENQK